MVKYPSGQLDAIFSALAHPTRRAILERLAEEPATVGALAEPFAMSLPAVSKHLRVLEDSGLLRRQRHGREFELRLEASAMRDALRWMERYRRFWEGSLDALADYLEKETTTKEKKGK